MNPRHRRDACATLIVLMPFMPPPPPAGFSFLISLITASVVSSRLAIDGGVLQGGAFDLGGDDHAHLDHVAVFVGQGVVAEVAARCFP